MNKTYKKLIQGTSLLLTCSSVVAAVFLYKSDILNPSDIPVSTTAQESMIADDFLVADFGAVETWDESADSKSTVIFLHLSKDELYEAMYEDIAPQDISYEHLDVGVPITTVEVTVPATTEDTTETSLSEEEITDEIDITEETTDERDITEDTTIETEVDTTEPPPITQSTTTITYNTTTAFTTVEPSDTRVWETSGNTPSTTTVASETTRIVDVTTRPATTTTPPTTTTPRTTTTATYRSYNPEDIYNTYKYTTTTTRVTTAPKTTTEATTSKAPFINPQGPGTYIDDDSIYREMLQLLNAERERVGLKPLWYSARVHEVTKLRVTECSYYYSHERPNHTKFSTAFKEAGISYKIVGENIAYGRNMFTSVQEVFKAWCDSPTHYENIINPKFECVAFGLNKLKVGSETYYYWAQEFCTFAEE